MATMKAAYINEPGPPENIQYGDLPRPEPQGAEVLVKVGAAALNPVDTYIRNGANYWELPKPFMRRPAKNAGPITIAVEIVG